MASLIRRIKELESQVAEARRSPGPLDHSSRLITGLRKINHFAQLLEHSQNVSDLCREAVLFVHQELGAERCGLYLVEATGLRGTWGIDTSLRLVREEDCFLPDEEHGRDRAEVHDPNDAKWELLEAPLREWRGGKPHVLSHGWLARTAIHSNGRLAGILFNDAVVSGSPPDPVLQELLPVFGGLLGRMVESLRARNELRRREAPERALAESRELPLHLQKMDAVARLAGGIAHDFNNLLTVIAGNLELMAEDLTDRGARIEGLDDARNAVERASSLTSQLLNRGRRQSAQPLAFRLADRFQLLDKMLRRSLRDDIRLRLRLEDNLRPLFADPAQIDQVIVNLAINASETMPDGGTLEITARDVEIEEPAASPWQGVHPGWHVELCFRDSGVGIAASGPGLASALGIVKKSGGDLVVESAPGLGTEFRILFPASSEQVQAAP